jgi:hypothetical protein
MAADYYAADTEDGEHWDDPSEDGLFILLSDLNQAGNSFFRVTPADDSTWYVTVTLLADGTYGVERGDPAHSEQDRDIATRRSDIARDVTIWLARRDYPGRYVNRPRTDC